MTTTISKLIRTLGAAALLAAAAGLPALPAYAEDNQGGSQPKLCASRGTDGSWDFHVSDSNPPSTVKGTRTRTNANGSFVEESANGTTYVCKDGGWHEVKQFVAPLRPIVVRPIGGVLAQHLAEPATALPQLVQIQAGGTVAQP